MRGSAHQRYSRAFVHPEALNFLPSSSPLAASQSTPWVAEEVGFAAELLAVLSAPTQ